MRHARAWAGALVLVGLAGCQDRPATRAVAQVLQPGGPQPDEIPVMLNAELPFRYPAALYDRKVQGNVTLRLFVDRDGRVRAESTRVEESSGYPPLDSAAVKGSQELRFVPAKLRGEPLPVAILFPVYFRHPEAPALPGDTVLPGRASGVGRTAPFPDSARRDSTRP
jgi:TonB family protein